MDFERTAIFTAEVIKAGAKAILVPSNCPAHHSPSHTGLSPLWRQAEEASLPIVMHVGRGGQLLDLNISTMACRRSKIFTVA